MAPRVTLVHAGIFKLGVVFLLLLLPQQLVGQMIVFALLLQTTVRPPDAPVQ